MVEDAMIDGWRSDHGKEGARSDDGGKALAIAEDAAVSEALLHSRHGGKRYSNDHARRIN